MSQVMKHSGRDFFSLVVVVSRSMIGAFKFPFGLEARRETRGLFGTGWLHRVCVSMQSIALLCHDMRRSSAIDQNLELSLDSVGQRGHAILFTAERALIQSPWNRVERYKYFWPSGRRMSRVPPEMERPRLS